MLKKYIKKVCILSLPLAEVSDDTEEDNCSENDKRHDEKPE